MSDNFNPTFIDINCPSIPIATVITGIPNNFLKFFSTAGKERAASNPIFTSTSPQASIFKEKSPFFFHC